jgi:NADP-reducing hydrogenase subunit HndB
MKTLEDLKKIREQAQKAMQAREGGHRSKIVVAMGTCGIASGAREVMAAILDELDKRGITDVLVTQSGCKGLCEQEPTVDVSKPGQPMVTYGYVTPEKARAIVAQHIVNDLIAGEWVVATDEKHGISFAEPEIGAGRLRVGSD